MTAKHLADGDADTALAFVANLADYLGLPRHWYVISSDHAGKGNMAAIHHEQQRYYATIYLGKNWQQQTQFERMHSLIHEVCHMAHRRVETAVRLFEPLVHDHEFDATWASVATELELMTDLWALALCRTEEVVALWDDANRPPITA